MGLGDWGVISPFDLQAVIHPSWQPRRYLAAIVPFSSWNLTSSEYLFIWLRRQRSGNRPGFRSSNIEHRCALHCIACVIRLGTDSAVMKEQSGGGSANVQPYGALCNHYVITILHLMLRQAHKPCGEGVNRINGT